MKFKALIDGVHYDPKKGLVKIQLIANRVSLDELTTLGPDDESIQVTLESEQTKLDVSPLEPGPITLEGEEAAAKLKEAADRLREGNIDGGPPEEREPEKRPYLKEADPDDVPEDEGPQDDESIDGDMKAEYEDG